MMAKGPTSGSAEIMITAPENRQNSANLFVEHEAF
jgi:hypothetical protein